MIWKQEWKKILKHPMMWGLLTIFILFDGLILWENIGDSYQEIQMFYEEVENTGIDETFYKESLQHYTTLDMMDVKEMKQELYQYNPEGSYKEFIDERYERLNNRVDEIIESGEAKESSYPGTIYRLHNKLYVKVLRVVFLEMGLLVIFAVLFLMDYERVNRTNMIVYTSKIGRKLQCTKLYAGIIVGLGFGALLLGIILVAWFLLIPYDGFWNTSISAALMTEPRGILTYPFITFHKMTFWQYLLATVMVGVFLVIIVGMIAGIIQFCTDNSYISFVSLIILFMLGTNLTAYSTESWLDIILSWNPADMWYRMGNWFMEGNLASNFEGAEIISIIAQLVVVGIISKIVYQRFLKKDY